MRKKSSWKRVRLAQSGARAAAQVAVGQGPTTPHHETADGSDLDEYLSDQDNQALLQEFSARELGFLTHLNPTAITRSNVLAGGPGAVQRAKKQQLPVSADEAEEEEAEEKAEEQESLNPEAALERAEEAGPRRPKSEWEEEEELATRVQRLPIKSIAGTLIPSKLKPADLPRADATLSEEEEAVQDELHGLRAQEAALETSKPGRGKRSASGAAEGAATALTAQDPRLRFVEAQEKLALLATQIIEDPERNIALLRNLRDLAGDKSHEVKCVALLTQLAVYKDILPGYRIRPAAEEGTPAGVKLSKEVQKLRTFEETLLVNYQAYLQGLEATLQTCLKRQGQADGPLATVAMKCLAELLVAATHFNFRLNLITSVVHRLHLRGGAFPDLPALAQQAICEVFRRDESGEWSLDILTVLSKSLKSRLIELDASILRCFLHLRLLEELSVEGRQGAMPGASAKSSSSKKRKKDEPHLSKRVKKAVKRDDSLLQEMREAEAVVSREERERNQSETLKHVFILYFRLLKTHTSPLIPTVLEGLSRFAHLISVDFFADLLAVLKLISRAQFQAYLEAASGTQGVGGSPARSAFHCVVSAFKMSTGQGEALNLDLKDFYTHMYNLLLSLSQPSTAASNLELVLQGLDLMFSRKAQIPLLRTAAFLKRLATLATSLVHPAEVLAVLGLMRALLLRFPKLEGMLDADGRQGTGLHRPDVHDPELGNALACSLWELGPLQLHAHPSVRKMAMHVASFGKSSADATGARGAAGMAVHRPLPQDLQYTSAEMLVVLDGQVGGRKLDIEAKGEAARARRPFVPKVVLPAAIAAALRRKRDRPLRRLDGPAAWVESAFVRGLQTQLQPGR